MSDNYRPVLSLLELMLIYRALKTTIPDHEVTNKIELYIHKINSNSLTPINQSK